MKNILYQIGETVYLIHDSEQEPLMVTEVRIKAESIEYMVCNGLSGALVDESELSRERLLTYLN